MSDSKPTRKAKHCIIHKQAREMAAHILSKCIEEKKTSHFAYPVTSALDRAVYYTGISKRTLLQIKMEAKSGPLRSPSRKGNKCEKYNNLKLDSFDRSALHECIQQFYSEHKVSPTGHELLAVVKEKLHFPWEMQSLRNLLRQMGYEWKRSVNGKYILVEKADIVSARSKYLQEIRQYRQEGRNIFFLVETYLDSDLKFKKKIENEPKDAITTTGTATKNRLILVHPGATNRFLNGENLLTKSSSTDNSGEEEYFENWVINILVPNLPPDSVIIMDYESQSDQNRGIPPKYGTKQEMREWLAQHDIKTADELGRDALYDLIQSHKSTFETSCILERYGFQVLKLPPYMYDLNPIELAWAKIKRVVAEKIAEADSSGPGTKNIAELVASHVSQVTEEDWRSHDNSVKVKEESYYSYLLNEEMDNITDEFETSDVQVKEEIKDEKDEEIDEEADDDFSGSEVSFKMEYESE